MTTPATDMARGGGPPNAPPGPTLLGSLSLLQPQYRWTRKSFFVYGTQFLPLTASLPLTNIIGIAGDSDFIVSFAECQVTDTTNLILLPFIPQLVQLQDTAGGLSLFSIPLPANLVYGTADAPGILASPYVFRQATQLSITHLNQEAVNRNVSVAMAGFKSYPGTDTRLAKWQN